MSKSIFFIISLCSCIQVQALFITANSNNAKNDTVLIQSVNMITGEPKLKRFLIIKPGVANSFHFDIMEAMTINIGNTEYLVSKDDSIHLSLDSKDGLYRISGGRFPMNYSMFSTIKSISQPLNLYNTKQDNYQAYIHSLDSVFALRSEQLNSTHLNNRLSSDVYNYLSSYIKYAHIYAMFWAKSSLTLKKSYPNTLSKFMPQVKSTDFTKDELCSMPMYILAGCSFIIFNGQRDALPYYQGYSLEYALDKLSGETRKTTALTLFVNYGFSKFVSKGKLDTVYNHMRVLGLPEGQMKSVTASYFKASREGKAIDTKILASSWVESYQNRKIVFSDLLNEFKGSKILLDFWASWCGPCIQNIPVVKELVKTHKDSNIVVIYVSLDSDASKWRISAEKNQITERQYLLSNDFKNSLATYLNIKEIPRYILIGRFSAIENIDFPLQFGIPN